MRVPGRALAAAARTGLSHRALALALLLPAAALSLPFLALDLHLDDYVVLAILSGREPLRAIYPSPLDVFDFFDGTAERTRTMLDLGLLPWWTAPGLQVSFWRPLAAVTHWIDGVGWPERPVLMHAHSLLWFGILAVTVGLMYRQLMGRTWGAGLAAIFYVIDDAHAFTVAWIAGRNALIATALGAAALLAHDRWRRGRSRAGATLAPLCLGLALLASEGAAAVGGYVLAHALCLDSGSWRRRAAALVPAGVVLATWQLVYTGLGYGTMGAAPGYMSPVREPALFLRALVENAPVMWLAQWGGPSSNTFAALSGAAAAGRWLVALLALAAVGLLLAPLLVRDRVARFWALGQVLALAPAGAFAPSDRYLFFVGLGAMGLIARFLTGWVDGEPWRPAARSWGVPAAAFAALLVVLHGILAPVRFVQTSAAVAALGVAQESASDSLPTDSGVRDQIVVIPTAPSTIFVAYLFFMRTVKRQPIPAHVRLLAAGAPVELYRPDARTLVVRHLGPAERMFRAPGDPMSPGARVDLEGTRVEVSAVDSGGLPREATFHFDDDLDSTRLRWLRLVREAGGRTRYVAFAPPRIGERLRLD